MHDLSDTPRARLARGPKAASAPHATGKLLIAAVVAVVALAAVGMSEAAMAQTPTEIKIGVLSASPPTLEAGPLEAMRLAQAAWNVDAIPAGFELKLEFIDIIGNPQDPGYPALVGERIGAAAANGYKHFIAPSDDQALLVVHSIVGATPELSNTILVSPAALGTFHPSLYDNDNLFRLVPNSQTQSLLLLEEFDKLGAERVVIVTDALYAPLVNSGTEFPDDAHEHYILPSFSIYGPGDAAQNVQSLTSLNDRLVELIDQHGEEQVAILAATQPQTFVTMANVLENNPQLDAVYDVKWFGYNYLGLSPFITADRVAAAFADDVDMNVVVYVVEPNEINAPLASLPAFNPSFRNANFASYDAVHLLADALAIGGADSPDLKDTVLDVANNNVHPVTHTDRLLGLGAIGDYTLDPATGDLIESRAYVTYHVVQSGDGYVWAEPPPPRVCR